MQSRLIYLRSPRRYSKTQRIALDIFIISAMAGVAICLIQKLGL